jgi:probable DNA repair protein
VLTLREAAGQDFDALWVCGLDADNWPPPPRPHPLVPLALQRAAGIPDATPAGTEARARLQFEGLLSAADELVLSWPAERDQAEVLPSPLLADLPPATSPAPGPVIHPDRDGVAASACSETVAVDAPPALATPSSVAGTARLLQLQALCPARAFVEFRLRASPLETPARPLDRAMRGRLLHRLLERLYQHVVCREGLARPEPAALRGAFDSLVDGVIREFLPPVDSWLEGLGQLERERLWALVQGLRILDADRPTFFVRTEVQREVILGGLPFRLRLDRVDELASGGELVLDYKTGAFSAAGWKQQRLPENQLPLYSVTGDARGAAVIHLRMSRVELRGVGQEDLEIPGIQSPTRFFRGENLDWERVLVRWRHQLEELVAEFRAGDFRVDPEDVRWAGGQFAGMTRLYERLAAGTEDDSRDESTL